MTYLSHLRAGLMASALLLTTALASPVMAETLPEISPRQIASDVEVTLNPETGIREYVAPSFDPFEEDPQLAGAGSLRSVSAGTTIDGQNIRGGALLDMAFYYNSASNDPYDTRGYTDAAFLTSEYAPVTYRDNRILECNEHIQDVVYYHEDYYRPSLYVNLFRPYRHYAGHYQYGFGYGYGYGQGFGFSNSFRGGLRSGTVRRATRRNLNTRRNLDRDRNRSRRSNAATGQAFDRAVNRARRADLTDAEREARRETRRENRANRTNEGETRRRNTRRTQTRPTETGRSETRPRTRASIARGAAAQSNQRNSANGQRRATPRAVAARRGAATSRPAPAARATSAPKAAASPRNRTIKSAPNSAPRAQRTQRSRPARSQSKSSRSTNQTKSSRSSQRSSPTRSRNTNKSSSRSTNRSSSRSSSSSNRGIRHSRLKLMNFLPMASAWSRNAVRNVDVHCAREELLTVHISQERLDAARFDGLTVLVLDRAGQELPVYVPPNYIEGFRQASGSQIAPSQPYQQPRSSTPITRGPVYQEPRRSIESAPCPVGTSKQNDGTCLQGGTNSYGGYPAR